MKVNIENEGQVHEFNLINKWEDVSLETYGKFIDYKKGSKTDDTYFILQTLSDIPKEILQKLELTDVLQLASQLAEIQEGDEKHLNNVISLKGKKYGFHPKLSSITLGEYADIETLVEQGFEKNLPEIMAVLYRPVIEETKDGYKIQAYDGEIDKRAEIFRTMKAKEVLAALVFFWDLGSELLMILKSSLMEAAMKKRIRDLTETLQSVGDGSE